MLSAVPLPDPMIAPAEPAVPVRPLWWLWLAGLVGMAGLGELARRWFWPTPKLACQFEVGPAALTGWSSPAISAPEVQFNVAIDLGEASAPSGVTIQPMEPPT